MDDGNFCSISVILLWMYRVAPALRVKPTLPAQHQDDMRSTQLEEHIREKVSIYPRRPQAYNAGSARSTHKLL